MKKITIPVLSLLLVLLFGCTNLAEDKSLKWNDNLESSVKIAKAENKFVLVNFTGSDWCVWCKKLMAEVFSQKEFAEYANKNLVLVKIDFPRSIEQSEATKKYNQDLAFKYGIQGFPTIVLLDKNGNLIAKTGYQPGGAANYVTHLKGLFSQK
ncbi:MAG: thioredoxin family protein [Ignavibacteriales bacterium]